MMNETEDKAARRARAVESQRAATYAKAQRGNVFVRNRAALEKWWREVNQNEKSLYAFGPTSPPRVWARRFSDWVWFERGVLATIVANCFTLALYRPLEERGSSWNSSLETAEIIFTVVFTIEFFTLVVARNFVFGPKDAGVYLRDGWRALDFAVVVGGWVSLGMMAAGGGGGGFTAVRSLRALRPLRTISGFPSLRIFVSTTLASMSMVLDVLMFLLVILIVLGTLGVQRFSGKLSNRCAHANNLQLVVDEIELPCSNSSFGRACGGSQICIATSMEGLDNNHSTFNNIIGAMFILYRVFTLRGWTDLMYRVIDGTGDRISALLYFGFAMVVGAIFVSSFMLAVVTSKYQQTAILDEQMALDEANTPQTTETTPREAGKRQSSTRNKKLTYKERLAKMMERPVKWMRSESFYQPRLKRIVKHRYVERIVMFCIIFNTLILAVRYRGMSQNAEAAFIDLNYFFLSVFVLELVLKVLALGVLGYIDDPYNRFDALIVAAGLIELGFRDSSIAVARAFRLLRVLRATRLITQHKSMRRLIDTTTQSFAIIINFCGVLLVFVFVFTVLGMQLFGGQPEYWDERPNFNTFGDSFMTIFEILTGSEWYQTMLVGMSGSRGGSAALFFISWSFIGSFILLNLILAMIVDTFSRSIEVKEAEARRAAREERERQAKENERKRTMEISALLGAKAGAKSSKKSLSSTELKPMGKKEIESHPDAKGVVRRIGARKQRAFAREVRLIENWLDVIGFDQDESDDDSGSDEETIEDISNKLATARNQLLDENAMDDGLPEGKTTKSIREQTGNRVSAFVARGVAVPMDERQIKSAYRRWRIDSAAEGSDSDEEMHILTGAKGDFDAFRTMPTTGVNAQHDRKALQEEALLQLKRSLIDQSADGKNQEALKWASQMSKAPVKSAVARMKPNEQRAIIAQRSAEGHAIGSYGKFRGEGMSREGAQALAEANVLSHEVRSRKKAVDTQERPRHIGVESAPSSPEPEVEAAPSVWRSKLKEKTKGERRKPISEGLKSFTDAPGPGPVTESFNNDNASSTSPPQTDASNSALQGYIETMSRSTSHRTGTTDRHSNTLMPAIEHITMPGLLDIDYSLPRVVEDSHASKLRKVSGLPVRDVVVDETKISDESHNMATEDDEKWMYRKPPGEVCMKYKSLGFIKPGYTVRRLMLMLIRSKSFEMLMLFFITLSCIQLAIDAPTVDPTSTLAAVIKAADVSLALIFLAEAIVKVIAMGFVMPPGSYLRSPANCLDFVIVVISLAVEALSASSLKFVRSFRLFRALRPLRLLSRLESMRLIVVTLLRALPDLGTVFLSGLFQFLIFAIFGSQLFSGKFDYCNDPTVDGRADCVGTFVNADGAHLSRQWLHPPLNFDSTPNAMLSLFVVVTRDGWLDIAFRGMDSNAVDAQPSLNKSGWTSIYFLISIIVLSFVWISTIVAVVCEHYKRASELNGETRMLTPEQQEWAEVLRIKRREAELRMLEDDSSNAPRFFIRKAAFAAAYHPRFESFIIACILLNAVFMASYHEGQSMWYSDTQRATNVFFAWVFLLELTLKMIALFPRRFFAESWNRFDFIIVVASIPDLAGADFLGTTVLRVIRLGRVLRLFKQAKGLRAVFDTCLNSVESAFNVIFLIFMLMFVYAVLGMSLFGEYDTVESLRTGRVENFRNFGSSLMVLLRVITRDEWKRIMIDTMKCEYDFDGVAANCTRIFVPAIYFTSFILMGAYFLLSLIIAVILNKFTENAANEGLLSTANIFVTIRRKLLLDMFTSKMKMKVQTLSQARAGPRRGGATRRRGK